MTNNDNDLGNASALQPPLTTMLLRGHISNLIQAERKRARQLASCASPEEHARIETQADAAAAQTEAAIQSLYVAYGVEWPSGARTPSPKPVESCPNCGALGLRLLTTSSEPQGIRQDRECPTCEYRFASHAGGLVPLKLRGTSPKDEGAPNNG